MQLGCKAKVLLDRTLALLTIELCPNFPAQPLVAPQRLGCATRRHRELGSARTISDITPERLKDTIEAVGILVPMIKRPKPTVGRHTAHV